MRILSSAAKCRRVARRMSLTTRSAGAFVGPDFCLIFAPSKGYDEPEILPSSTRPFCLTIPDGKQVQIPPDLADAMQASTHSVALRDDVMPFSRLRRELQELIGMEVPASGAKPCRYISQDYMTDARLVESLCKS